MSSDPQVFKLAERNERAVLSLSRMVDDLLDSARITTGRLNIERRQFDLRDAVRGASDMILPIAEAKRLSLAIESDPTPIQVFGDRDRLQQALGNLLGNAVKFTPEGGRVKTSIKRIDGHVELTVSDTGVGIAPECLPSLFDRFATARRNSTHENKDGLGLGLSLTKYIVEAHGGNIRASSDGEGKGTTFIVRLPLENV